jgi:hypothetical protein
MADELTLECHPVGRVLVVRPGPPDPGQLAFAAGLAADPDSTVVILDLPADCPTKAWSPVLGWLASQQGSLRLVCWDARAGGLVKTGQRLADALGRTVLAQDGRAVTAALGGLFVPSTAGTGWFRLQPGQQPAAESRRFPRPRWTAAAPLEHPRTVGGTTVLQPLPGGAWLYPQAPESDARVRELGLWLCSNLAWSHDVINLVLGYPGAPALAAADIALFWSTLPEEVRPALRFVSFGTAVPDGQELADATGHRMVLSAGFPVGGWHAADAVRVTTLRDDRGSGWEPFAAEVSYRPWGTAPQPSGVTLPAGLAELPELSPCVYALEPGIVLEVVRSGLWLRPPTDPPGAVAVRLRAADPAEPTIWVDAALAESTEHALARVLAALEPRFGDRYKVLPGNDPDAESEAVAEAEAVADAAADAEAEAEAEAEVVAEAEAVADSEAELAEIEEAGLAEIEEAGLAEIEEAGLAEIKLVGLPEIRLESGPSGELTLSGSFGLLDPARADASPQSLPTVQKAKEAPATAEPAATAAAAPKPAAPKPAAPKPRVQSVPSPQACALPPAGGIAHERIWLQRSLTQQFSATANSVARVLSQTPGLRAGGDGTAQDVLADLVAVRLYLSGHGQRIDDAVRTARVGPHVPFARCVTSGLRRLPSYRGATRLRATLADAEWRWYSDRRLVTEWAFCPALTDGGIRLTGAVEFKIWSMTARRTSLLAPDIASQVLFLPGTSFKVLSVCDGQQREVLLRELSPGEIAPDGKVETGQVPLDDVALHGLEKAGDAWERGKQDGELPEGYARRFGNPPGLLLVAGEPGEPAGATPAGPTPVGAARAGAARGGAARAGSPQTWESGAT